MLQLVTYGTGRLGREAQRPEPRRVAVPEAIRRSGSGVSAGPPPRSVHGCARLPTARLLTATETRREAAV